MGKLLRILACPWLPGETKPWQQVPGQGCVNRGVRALSLVCAFASLSALSSLSTVPGTGSSWASGRHIVHMAHSWTTSNTISKHVVPWLLYHPRVIHLGGLLRVFLQVFGDKAYSVKHLHLIISDTLPFLYDGKGERMQYKNVKCRNYVYNIKACSYNHSVKSGICCWSKFNNMYVCRATQDLEKISSQYRWTLRHPKSVSKWRVSWSKPLWAISVLPRLRQVVDKTLRYKHWVS